MLDGARSHGVHVGEVQRGGAGLGDERHGVDDALGGGLCVAGRDNREYDITGLDKVCVGGVVGDLGGLDAVESVFAAERLSRGFQWARSCVFPTTISVVCYKSRRLLTFALNSL